MFKKKHASGYQKRKKRERDKAIVQSQAGAIVKYFDRRSKQAEPQENVNDDVVDLDMDVAIENEETNTNEFGQKLDEDIGERKNDSFFSSELDDPGNWVNIDHKLRDYLVEMGPKRVESIVFPKDGTNRRFDVSQYKRVLPCGKIIDRSWLVYSVSKDRVYCFCCKLFPTPETLYKCGLLSSDGFGDWHNLGRALKSHDKNPNHLECTGRWGELESRLKKNSTIDSSVQILMNEEKAHWREVLTRIIVIVTTLAKNTLPFRGDNEKLYSDNNGLFLQLVEMVAKFDPRMKEHIRRATTNEIQYTYLGKHIQNELIQMLASEVRSSILKIINHAKFFSVILDCTPDASHEEQMSLVIRCVNDSTGKVVVEEFWLEFLKIDDTSGLGIFTELQNVLSKLGLNVDDIRGQGYDNGANMSGKYKGVQRRLLEINSRAFYTPCGCHSLNLTLCDMVRCNAKARDFFTIIQKIYTFFSSSTKRWAVFKDKVKGLTVKSLSTTRWESHIESIKPIKNQTQQIIDALLELAESDTDDNSKFDARTYSEYIADFEFLLSLIIWHNLLFQVNRVSKYLQAENMDIDGAITLLKGLTIFLEDFRKNGFDIAMQEAKAKASELEIEAVFREKRIIRKKKQFDENVTNVVHLSPEESFRIEYFICIVDQAQSSLKARFESFTSYSDTFGFLFDIGKMRKMSYNELKECSIKLEKHLTSDGHQDIDGEDLCNELNALRMCMPGEMKRAMEVFEYLATTMCDKYPQAYIAYQILLTLPVTVASAERSFSKLKLLKTYLRSTMSQERLNGLALLSIEKEMVEQLDCENLISVFASKTARRVIFK